MYLPRQDIALLYNHLFARYHPGASQVLILVALEPDALCACRILTALFKRDYIGHKIQPVAGYDDLLDVGKTVVSKMRTQNGGTGGVVVCLGVGGLVDMSNVFDMEDAEDGTDPSGGVQVWLIDARRPWNLGNIFAGDPKIAEGQTNGSHVSNDGQVVRGEIQASFKMGRGGVIVYDDGDITLDLQKERQAYCALLDMGDVDDDEDSLGSDSDEDADEEAEQVTGVNQTNGKKRKTWEGGDGDSDEDLERPRRRRRSGSHESDAFDDQETPAADVMDTDDGVSNPQVPGSPAVQVASSLPQTLTSQRTLRKRFLRERRKYNEVLRQYYSAGASYSEPISSILYSLATEVFRDDNQILWNAIVGITSLELYGRSMTGVGISLSSDVGGSAGWGGSRGENMRQELRDEVNRLNPQDDDERKREAARGLPTGTILTAAKSPADHAIRVSPEPRFLLIRHWSLYDSMLHSPYLGSRLHIWSEQGRKRLHKLLAKMGVSLSQCKQSYTHMDMDLKKGLRQRLLSYAPLYGLEGLVPLDTQHDSNRQGWSFIKCWGWKGCFSAQDVGVIIGAILEVGKSSIDEFKNSRHDRHHGPANGITESDESGVRQGEEWVRRFWEAYDALDNVDALKLALPTAQHLHRAIIRAGTTIIEKRQIRHLKAFRIAVVKEGPDLGLFAHPGALTKLALWIGEAIAEQEREQRGQIGKGGTPTPLVLACLNEHRGIYVVVGTGGGGGVVDFAARARRKVRHEEKQAKQEEKKAEKEKAREEKREKRRDDGEASDEDEEESEEDDDDDDSDDSDEETEDQGYGRNRFGNAFQEVVDETNARVRIDSFENCVVEVKKEDLSQFLESLSMKVVVG